jgi:SAM-dependent methyltransferase
MGKVPMAGIVEYSSHTIALERVPEIWKCRACRSWFTQNAVPPDRSESLYSGGSSGARWVAEPFEKSKGPELLAEFDRHVDAATRILDIGCSTGQLLDYAKARGAKTCGMDLSADCGEIVRQKGHRFAASLPDLGTEQFDVVTAFDVIEHVYDLPGFLAKITRMLNPGGKLIFLTGDIDSLGARICGSRWWYLRYPEHIVFPSRQFFGSRPQGLRLDRTVRTYASVGYRVPFIHALRAAASLAIRRSYEGLPALGPDHILLVMRRG